MLGEQPEFDSAQESSVQGPGDGTSDDIPAQLSDGEYVMDANTVSMLGNGSNKAGAARLGQLRENLRKHAARSMKGGKQFMKAKPRLPIWAEARGRSKMANSPLDFLFQGTAPSQYTNTGQNATNVPQWLQEYAQGILTEGAGVASSPILPMVVLLLLG